MKSNLIKWLVGGLNPQLLPVSMNEDYWRVRKDIKAELPAIVLNPVFAAWLLQQGVLDLEKVSASILWAERNGASKEDISDRWKSINDHTIQEVGVDAHELLGMVEKALRAVMADLRERIS